MMRQSRIPRTGLRLAALIGLVAVSALLWATTVWASGQVTFSDLPDAHGGDGFTFTLTYNVDDHPTSYKNVPGEVTVVGGTVDYVKRASKTGLDRNKVWTVTVEPNGSDDVTLTVRGVSATVPKDEPAPAGAVTLTLSHSTIAESGDGNVSTVTATLASASTAETTITVSVDPNDTTRLSSNTTLTIAAGQTSSTGEVTITAVDDSDYTGDREVTVRGAAANTVGATDPADVTLIITEDESKPVTVAFGSAAYTADEGGTVSVEVTLNVDPERTVTIPLTTTNQDGAEDADYSGVPADVTFNSGETSKTFTFTATDDQADDDSDSVLLRFGNLPDGVSAGATNESTVSITDDDVPAGAVTLALSHATIAESGDGNVSTVTATLESASTAETTITVSVDPAGTTRLSSNTTLTIAAGQTSSTGEVTITAVDDSDYTGDRGVTVRGAATNTVGAEDPAGVTLTITEDDARAGTDNNNKGVGNNERSNDDDTPALVVSSVALSISEGAEASFTLSLQNVDIHAIDPVTVQIRSDNRYVRATPNQIEIEHGDETTEYTVTVSARTDDNSVDDTATLSITAITTFGINGILDLSQTVTVSVVDTISVPEPVATTEPETSEGLAINPDQLAINPDQLVIVPDVDEAFVLSATAITIDRENGSYILTVKLASEPTNTVTVDITIDQASYPGALTASQTTLSFRTDNYDDTQQVILRAQPDVLDDYWGDAVIEVTVSENGSVYNPPDAILTVTVIDDDFSRDPSDYNWNMTTDFHNDSYINQYTDFTAPGATVVYNDAGDQISEGPHCCPEVNQSSEFQECFTIHWGEADAPANRKVVGYLILSRHAMFSGVVKAYTDSQKTAWSGYDRLTFHDETWAKILKVTTTPSYRTCDCGEYDRSFWIRAIYDDRKFSVHSSSEMAYDAIGDGYGSQ